MAVHIVLSDLPTDLSPLRSLNPNEVEGCAVLGAGFDSQCRILSDAQIGALVVRTFSERFVGASCKIQSHLYRSWPAIHTYRQRPKIATMTRSRPIAPPWP